MGIKRKVKSVSMVVDQLTDPKPELVSFVRHGANQTPFRAVKSEQTIADFTDLETTEEPMTKKSKAKKEDAVMPSVAEIQKVTFKSANFADEAAVTEYLTVKGYTDFEVTKTAEGFEVLAKDASEFEGEAQPVSFDDGATFYVGKLAAGSENLETQVEAVKTQKAAAVKQIEKVMKSAGLDDATVKKYCDCYGCYSSYTPPAGKTIADVLTEQYDSGNFPAYWELSSAFDTALRNLIKEGDTASIKTLTAEYADMIVGILAALDSAGVDVSVIKEAFIKEPENEEAMKTKTQKNEETTAAADPKVDAPAADGKTTEGEVVEVEGEADDAAGEGDAGGETEAEKAAKEKDKAKDGKGKDKPKDETVDAPAKKADEVNIAEVIAKAVTDAIEPLKKQVEELSTTVKGTSEGLEQLQDTVSKTASRVDEMGNTVSTRKSADVTGIVTQNPITVETPDENARKNAEFMERSQRKALGFGV